MMVLDERAAWENISLVSTVHSLTIRVFILEMGENIVGETRYVYNTYSTCYSMEFTQNTHICLQ